MARPKRQRDDQEDNSRKANEAGEGCEGAGPDPHNDWRPHSYQEPLWNYMEDGGLRGLAVSHRRWGKDELGLQRVAVAAHERTGTYWTLLPQANQARKAIWNAVDEERGVRRIDLAFPEAIRATTNEQEMFIRFKCGSTWQVVGSDNFNSLVGSPPVGVVLSEWALANPAAWPRHARRRLTRGQATQPTA